MARGARASVKDGRSAACCQQLPLQLQPCLHHLRTEVCRGTQTTCNVHHTTWRAVFPAAAVGSSPPADETIVRAIQLCLARALALAQGRCATARLSSYGSSNRPASRGGANLERVGEADDDLQMRVARSYVRLKPSRAQISPQYRHRRGRGGKIDVDRTVLRCHDWARVLRRRNPRLSRRVFVVDEGVQYCPFVLLWS